MRKNEFLMVGILAALLIFGLALVGCGDSSSGDPTTPPGGGDNNPAGLRAKLNNNQYPGKVIDVYPGATATSSHNYLYGANGFSVTVDDVSQEIEMIDLDIDKNKIYLVSAVPGTGDIKISYDGTCTAAEKLPRFTNLAVAR
jgi:hypothetical protein